MITVFGELVASQKDLEGYITYVFKLLDDYSIKEMNSSYLMAVRYYNWQDEPVTIGSKGFVKVKEVKAGVDQWWDGVKNNYYRYDDVIFYKFIPYIEDHQNEIIL
jgi:hypothetical protein